MPFEPASSRFASPSFATSEGAGARPPSLRALPDPAPASRMRRRLRKMSQLLPSNPRLPRLASLFSPFRPLELHREIGPGARPIPKHEWESAYDPLHQHWLL
jgi:hypothetical protein